jgi:hypothetical protein
MNLDLNYNDMLSSLGWLSHFACATTIEGSEEQSLTLAASFIRLFKIKVNQNTATISTAH